MERLSYFVVTIKVELTELTFDAHVVLRELVFVSYDSLWDHIFHTNQYNATAIT